MGSSLGLTFGGTSIYATAHQGLEITTVDHTKEGIEVRFKGNITFSINDPYDFKVGLPGARDAHRLEVAGKAKIFEMQVH